MLEFTRGIVMVLAGAPRHAHPTYPLGMGQLR